MEAPRIGKLYRVTSSIRFPDIGVWATEFCLSSKHPESVGTLAVGELFMLIGLPKHQNPSYLALQILSATVCGYCLIDNILDKLELAEPNES